MSTSPRSRRRTIRLGITAGAIVLLIAVMVANTRFLSAADAEALTPQDFDAAVFAQEEFPGIVESVRADATDLVEVVAAVTADPAAAGPEYGNVAGTDKYAIPVTFTGVANAADANFITVAVEGLQPGISVRVPLAAAVNGTALRDVTGKIRFADFPGQTDYQQVANEFKTLATTEVIGAVDPAALVGTQISVDGVYVTNSGPDGTFIVTPVAIGAGS